MIDERETITAIAKDEPARILLFGMDCLFTTPIAESLLAIPEAQIVAIVLAGAASAAQTGEFSPMRHIAASASAPVIELPDRNALWSSAFRSTLADFDADLIVVACFPWRLPPDLVSLPRIASLNIHPSLLPDGRGPEPVFWAFRRGLDRTGVSLHIIDDDLDTGPIVSQRAVAIPEDATIITLECSLADGGAELLREFLMGRSSLASARSQAADAEYAAPFPDTSDLLVTTAWNGSTAARFIDAAAPVYGFIEVLILATGQRLAVANVLAIEECASDMPVVSIRGDHAWIEFADSRLHCRLRAQRQQLLF